VRSAAAVERLRVPDPEESVGPVLEAIAIVRAELDPAQAVVGFAAARSPWRATWSRAGLA
jgi:uroporphyrinogen decarboxylase